jgi:hypothetical protein
MAAAWNEGYYQVDLRLPVTTGRLAPAGTGSKDLGSKGMASKRTA